MCDKNVVFMAEQSPVLDVRLPTAHTTLWRLVHHCTEVGLVQQAEKRRRCKVYSAGSRTSLRFSTQIQHV